MLRTLSIILAVQTSSTANMIIFYSRKLPLFHKLITTKFYADITFKKYVAIIARLLIIVFKFISSFAYVGLILYLPITMLGPDLSTEEQLRYFIHLFFMLSFVVAGVSNAIILEPKRNKFVAIKLLRMSPARYIKATLCYKYVMFFIYLLIAMLVFGSILGGTVVQLILLTLCATMWRLLCEVAHLKYYEKTSKTLIKQNSIVWLWIAGGFTVAYLPLIMALTPVTSVVLAHFSAIAIFIALGLYAISKLARYDDYRALAEAATKRDDPLLNIGQLVADANKTSVSSKEDDYSLERASSDKFQGKAGHAYLNAIFYARHRSLIKRPVNMRLAIVAGIGLLATIVLSLFDSWAEYVVENVGYITSFLALALFYLSVGERMCKAIFFNCDLSLLRYPFYRNSTAEHFRIRLYKMSGQNLSIAVMLAVVLTLVYYVAGGPVLSIEMLLIWLSIIMLAIFFSIHHLFMYYVLQPYSTELNVKNPLFTVLTIAIAYVCGITIFIPTPMAIYTIVVCIITMLYLAIALVTVNKHGSRTFRVK